MTSNTESHGESASGQRAATARGEADGAALRTVLFGTFDEGTHPRVRGIREGLRNAGVTVEVLNAPLRYGTDARVTLAANPARALPGFLSRLLRCWLRLIRLRLRLRGPIDAVLIGYMGHFDIHLARLLFPRTPLVLDHMIGLGDTVRDRALDGRSTVNRLLEFVDRSAQRRADVVLFDTEEHRRHLGGTNPAEVVVPVGAPRAWFDAAAGAEPDRGSPPLRVVFFGLYTPLQGTQVIGDAIAQLADDDRIQFTMIGGGQDRARVEARATSPNVTWLDWVDADELPDLVASNHVCLGTFGTSPKAMRVVPNKVYQGAAAGTLVVTADTECQREMLGNAAVFVPPGNAGALAETLRDLAGDRDKVARLRAIAGERARDHFTPAATAVPLIRALNESASGRSAPTRGRRGRSTSSA